MPKVIYICLGSNFSQTLESEVCFLNELSEAGYEPSIYSVDVKELPDSNLDSTFPVTRVSMNLNMSSIDELVDGITSAERDNDVRGVIIMDGIDFKHSDLGAKIKEKMDMHYDNSLLASKLFHFISFNYENPTFDGKDIKLTFDFKNFLLTDPQLESLAYNKSRLGLVGNAISKQISNSPYPLNEILNFIKSPAFNNIFESNQHQARAIILESLTKTMCHQISLTKLELEHSLSPPTSMNYPG